LTEENFQLGVKIDINLVKDPLKCIDLCETVLLEKVHLVNVHNA